MAQAPAGRNLSARKSATVAYFCVGLVVLSLIALLPFALTSVAEDVLDQSVPVYDVTRASPAEPIHSDAHLQITSINEWDGTASIRASLHQNCVDRCPWGDRYIFTSVYGDTEGGDELRPSSTIVTLPATTRDHTEDFKLPIFGDPIRYPFDQYRLALGVIVQRIQPDGSIQTLSTEEARPYVTISIQGRIPRATMSRPLALDPADVPHEGVVEPYVVVEELEFQRPLYMQVLTILLVILVSAAAAYAVFLRPLNELIVGSGALVLGVWGVRGILLGTGLPGVTAVDLSLSVVILFLLATITIRTAWLLEESSMVRPLRSRLPPTKPPPDPPRPEYLPGRDGASAEDPTVSVSAAPAGSADREGVPTQPGS